MIMRYTSQSSLFGVPLVAIASRPDKALGERIGHARGIIALSDIASEVVACGTIARGAIAVGAVGFCQRLGRRSAMLLALPPSCMSGQIYFASNGQSLRGE